jgi:hypothetical protein
VIDEIDDAHLLDAGGMARGGEDRESQCCDGRVTQYAHSLQAHLIRSFGAMKANVPGEIPGTRSRAE